MCFSDHSPVFSGNPLPGRLKLERCRRHRYAGAGAATDRDKPGIGGLVTHYGSSVPTATAVLNCTHVCARGEIGRELRGRIRTARLDQHLAGGSIVVTLANPDRFRSTTSATRPNAQRRQQQRKTTQQGDKTENSFH